MNEADVTKTHAATIDALNELAASLIRSGAPVDAVQKFVDAEIDRIEFMQGKEQVWFLDLQHALKTEDVFNG